VPVELSARALERGRARCPRCALDVALVREEHGDGPGRTGSFLTLRAPALAPSARLVVERNHARLSLSLAPASRIALATGGLGAGVAVTAAGAAGIVPLALAGVAFLGLVAFGFTLAARERSALHILVEPTAIDLNGGRRPAPATTAGLDLDPGGHLSEAELRWLRAVIDARLAGDRDARADR
jgi:hypothetical protein